MNNKFDPKRLYKAYLRVSTQLQTFDRQRYNIDQWSKANGICIDEWIESKVSSRKSINERGLELLLEKMPKFGIIVTDETNRLTRTMMEILPFVESLRSKNISIYFLKEDIFVDGGSRRGKAPPMNIHTTQKLNLYTNMGQLQRDLLSLRIKDGMKKAKIEGKLDYENKSDIFKKMTEERIEDSNVEHIRLITVIEEAIEAGAKTNDDIADYMNEYHLDKFVIKSDSKLWDGHMIWIRRRRIKSLGLFLEADLDMEQIKTNVKPFLFTVKEKKTIHKKKAIIPFEEIFGKCDK